MRDVRSSAAYRIAFSYFAAFALAIVALGAAVYFAADANFRRQQDSSIAEESDELVRAYRSEGLDDLREAIAAREATAATNGFDYALFDAAGRRLAGSLDIARLPAGWQDIIFNDPEEGPDPARALATALPGERLLVVAIDTEALERIDRTILILFAVAFVAMIVVGVIGALLLGGYLRRRLERIGGTAQAIVAGDLDRRIPVSGAGDEFDRLGGYLNAMLDRITQLVDNLRQVSSDVAHDLRTPLARLRGELEAALDGPNDSREQRVALKRALSQSDALLSLFAAILRISEIEGGGIERSFTRIDLSGLVTDLCDSYAPAVGDGGRALGCKAEREIVVSGDRELIAQALINLLDNAQAHTPAGTNITIDVEAGDDWARVTVADDGPGVPEADRSRIARRFVRLDGSRTTPGHGLGLNLVAAIAAAHGGDLVIGDNGPGLRVTIILPRLPA